MTKTIEYLERKKKEYEADNLIPTIDLVLEDLKEFNHEG